MIAMTTKSSMSVKPLFLFIIVFPALGGSALAENITKLLLMCSSHEERDLISNSPIIS